MNPNKMPSYQETYKSALMISLALFGAAFIVSLSTVFMGVWALSSIAFAFGWVGVIYGLLLLFAVSWFSNRISRQVLAEKRKKRLDRISKCLEYCGYGFVIWSMIGLVLVLRWF